MGSNPHLLTNNNMNMDDPSIMSRSYLSQPMNMNGSSNNDNNNNMMMMMMGGGVPAGSATMNSMMNDSYISGAYSGHSGSTPPGSQYSAEQYSHQQYSQGTPPQGMMDQFGYPQPQMDQFGYPQPPQMDAYGQQQMVGGGGMYGVGGEGGDGVSSFGGSRGQRSLANSAALIPRAKFSWASESIGTQSTVLTRRSLNTASVPEPQHEREGNKVVAGRVWASFAWIITFPIPNKCIMRPTKDAKQAWREKVALFVIMVSCSVFFVGVFGFVPLLLCKEDTIFSMQDIWLQTGESWVVVHGTIYDVKDLIYRHPGGVKGIVDYLGKDGSKVFPRAPPVTLPQMCLDMEKVSAFNLDVYTPENNFTNPTCQSFSELDVLLGVTCHTFAAGSNGTAKFLGDYTRGVIKHTSIGLNEEVSKIFCANLRSICEVYPISMLCTRRICSCSRSSAFLSYK